MAKGNASATITATLEPEGDGTRVKVVSDLTISGRAAQFGRGVLADVTSRLVGQFVACLETTVLGDEGVGQERAKARTEAREDARPTEPRRVERAPAEAVDVLSTVGVPVLKRLLPVVIAALVAWWAQRGVRRRFRGRR